jgi:hypothetical protein
MSSLSFLDNQLEEFVYGMAIIFWLILAFVLGLFNRDIIVLIISLIPVVVFSSFILNKTCIYSAAFPRISSEFLYIILAIFLVYIFVAKTNKEEIIRLVLVALVIYILSLIDFKICNKILFDASVIVPESIAATLILITIYLYFMESYSGINSNTKFPI